MPSSFSDVSPYAMHAPPAAVSAYQNGGFAATRPVDPRSLSTRPMMPLAQAPWSLPTSAAVAVAAPAPAAAGPYALPASDPHARVMQLRTDILQFIPRVEREQYIENMVADLRRERQTARVARRKERPIALPSQQLFDGIKTSRPDQNTLFSCPTSIGVATERVLQKQRHAERKALESCGCWNDAGRIGRRLPW